MCFINLVVTTILCFNLVVSLLPAELETFLPGKPHTWQEADMEIASKISKAEMAALIRKEKEKWFGSNTAWWYGSNTADFTWKKAERALIDKAKEDPDATTHAFVGIKVKCGSTPLHYMWANGNAEEIEINTEDTISHQSKVLEDATRGDRGAEYRAAIMACIEAHREYSEALRRISMRKKKTKKLTPEYKQAKKERAMKKYRSCMEREEELQQKLCCGWSYQLAVRRIDEEATSFMEQRKAVDFVYAEVLTALTLLSTLPGEEVQDIINNLENWHMVHVDHIAKHQQAVFLRKVKIPTDTLGLVMFIQAATGSAAEEPTVDYKFIPIDEPFEQEGPSFFFVQELRTAKRLTPEELEEKRRVRTLLRPKPFGHEGERLEAVKPAHKSALPVPPPKKPRVHAFVQEAHRTEKRRKRRKGKEKSATASGRESSGKTKTRSKIRGPSKIKGRTASQQVHVPHEEWEEKRAVPSERQRKRLEGSGEFVAAEGPLPKRYPPHYAH